MKNNQIGKKKKKIRKSYISLLADIKIICILRCSCTMFFFFFFYPIRKLPHFVSCSISWMYVPTGLIISIHLRKNPPSSPMPFI